MYNNKENYSLIKIDELCFKPFVYLDSQIPKITNINPTNNQMNE